MYAAVGNRNISIGDEGNGWIPPADVSTQQPTDNSIYAFNTVLNANTRVGQLLLTGTWTKGTAIVQNVIEKVTTIDELMAISGDGNTATSDNVMVWHNTFVGERENAAYNETGTTANFHTNYSVRGNLLSNHNIKTDTFGTQSGARVGNWAEVYGVGYAGNDLKADQAGVYFGPDFDGVYTITGATTLGFSKDRSYATGDRIGNGNYELNGSSGIRSYVPAGTAVLPFDIRGNPRSNTGLASIGAYEFLSGFSGKQYWQGKSSSGGKN